MNELKENSYWSSRDYYFEQQFERSNTEFIYSRNSPKGNIQDINNPGKNWGLTKDELEYYNSKYSKQDYGQTLQGFIRNQSIKEERELSKIEAKSLFPDNKKKQQEYINYVHDHGLTSYLGRNKRCVWEIPTVPHSESHFAIFPEELVETPIKAGCPKYVCEKCGFPREKIIKNVGIKRDRSKGKQVHKGIGSSNGRGDLSGEKLKEWKEKYPDKFLGYSDCGCYDNIKYSKAGLNLSPTSTILTKTVQKKQFKEYTNCDHNSKWQSGIVLDPFAGIGTTLLTAWKLGRNFIGFEISKKYCEIANKKL